MVADVGASTHIYTQTHYACISLISAIIAARTGVLVLVPSTLNRIDTHAQMHTIDKRNHSSKHGCACAGAIHTEQSAVDVHGIVVRLRGHIGISTCARVEELRGGYAGV